MGWNNSNTFVSHTFTDNVNNRLFASYAATAGQYIPIRIQYGQVTGPYVYQISITGPDGRVMLDNTTSISNKFVEGRPNFVEMRPSTCAAFPPAPSCTNPFGYTFAVFSDAISGAAADLDATKYKTRAPVYNGTFYTNIYINNACSTKDSTATFNGYTTNCNNLVFQWRGYLYASQTGTYTFAIPTTADDKMYLWLGSLAYSGYTNTNTNASVSYAVPSTGVATFNATAGQYIPYRVMLAQNTGLVLGSLQVTAPDGKLLMDPSSPSTNTSKAFDLGYPCASSVAPAFAAWGTET